MYRFCNDIFVTEGERWNFLGQHLQLCLSPLSLCKSPATLKHTEQSLLRRLPGLSSLKADLKKPLSCEGQLLPRSSGPPAGAGWAALPEQAADAWGTSGPLRHHYPGSAGNRGISPLLQSCARTRSASWNASGFLFCWKRWQLFLRAIPWLRVD